MTQMETLKARFKRSPYEGAKLFHEWVRTGEFGLRDTITFLKWVEDEGDWKEVAEEALATVERVKTQVAALKEHAKKARTHG
jgi:hypothetical protein